MKLYGSFTSPYVRRVRIVAKALGLTTEFVHVNKDDGQTQLRRVTPLWKFPVAEVDGLVLFDSHNILEYLLNKPQGSSGSGSGTDVLRTDSKQRRWEERNIQTVIDGALDAAINHLIFRSEGVDAAGTPYLEKQIQRTRSGMAWVADRLKFGAYFTEEPRVGLSELYLYTALDYFRFRELYDPKQRVEFVRFLEVHEKDRLFEGTEPSVT